MSHVLFMLLLQGVVFTISPYLCFEVIGPYTYPPCLTYKIYYISTCGSRIIFQICDLTCP